MILLVVLPRPAGHRAATLPPDPKPFVAFTLLIQIIIGFFATAGAAGADFGMNSRNEKDVRMGGLVGITLAIVFAGGIAAAVGGRRAACCTTLPGLRLRRRHPVDRRRAGHRHVLAVHHRLDRAGLLLRLHRGQQLFDHDTGRAAHFLHHGGRHRVDRARGHRRGRRI